MSVEDEAANVASIVEHRTRARFVHLLKLADRNFTHPDFESALADRLRREPALIDAWETWSEDQRWSPSAYVRGIEAGWYDAGFQHVRTHPDRAAAVADFIHRMAAWLARREVLTA